LTKVSFAEALQFEFADFPEGSPVYRRFTRQRWTGTPVRTRVRATSHASFCAWVEAGIGIGVGPEPSVRRAAKSMSKSPLSRSDDDNALLTGSLFAPAGFRLFLRLRAISCPFHQ